MGRSHTPSAIPGRSRPGARDPGLFLKMGTSNANISVLSGGRLSSDSVPVTFLEAESPPSPGWVGDPAQELATSCQQLGNSCVRSLHTFLSLLDSAMGSNREHKNI